MTELFQMLKLVGDVEDLVASVPEGKKLLAEIREGGLSEEEAVQKILKVVRDNGLLPGLRQASEEIHSLVPRATASALDELRDSKRPLMMKTSTGIPQLNPLVEAAIAERASLDGDVPELRHGPLPEGGRPAVPVKMTARDPVVIGMMLDQAAEEVSDQLRFALENHSLTCARLLDVAKRQAAESGLDEQRAIQIAEQNLPTVPFGVPGYEAGKLPELREVRVPPPHIIAHLPDEQRRMYAYNSLATTQGRTSGAPVIQEALLEALGEYNVCAGVGKPAPEALLVEINWAAVLMGKDEVSEGFSPIQTAIDFLRYHLKNVLEAPERHTIRLPKGYQKSAFELRVAPFNGISDRRFGWTAQLHFRRDS